MKFLIIKAPKFIGKILRSFKKSSESSNNSQ